MQFGFEVSAGLLGDVEMLQDIGQRLFLQGCETALEQGSRRPEQLEMGPGHLEQNNKTRWKKMAEKLHAIPQMTFWQSGLLYWLLPKVGSGCFICFNSTDSTVSSSRHHHWHHPTWLPHPQDSVAHFWPRSQPSPTEVGRISHHRWCLRTQADDVNRNQQQTCTLVDVLNVFQYIPRKNCQPGLKTHSSHQLEAGFYGNQSFDWSRQDADIPRWAYKLKWHPGLSHNCGLVDQKIGLIGHLRSFFA